MSIKSMESIHSISLKQLDKGEDLIIKYKGLCPYLGKEYIAILLFDGHGDISKIFLNTLENLPLESIIKYSHEPTKEIQRQLEHSYLPIRAGATCSIVKIFDDHIDVETTGDSKAIVAINNNIVYVSPEHNYHNPEEKKRLEYESKIFRNKKSNGILVLSPTTITQDPDPISTTIYDKKGNNICLSLTQSIGHHGITGICPDRRKIYFSSKDKVDVVVASDGVWDMMNHEFEEDLAMFLSSNTTSEDIMKEAEKRWKQAWKYDYEGRIYNDQKIPTYDDISVGIFHKI